jgi:hypothetical protein
VLLLRTASHSCLGLFALLASCTAVPPGAVSLEARGSAHSAELWGGIANALLSGSYSTGSGSSGYDAGSAYRDTDDDTDWHTSYGLRTALSTPVVDLIAGADEHVYDGHEADELSFGVRKRIAQEGDRNPGYLLFLARHGNGLRTDKGHADYDGVAVGIGMLTAIDEHWFFDISLEAEWLWDQVVIDANDTYLFSMMLNVGIGFAL